jgi:hypothetical protein
MRNRWGISSGMVQRQDTSVAPSLRVTCGRVLCLCLRAVSATTGLCFCCIVRGPGYPLDLAWCLLLPLCPSPASPEQQAAASRCSLRSPTRCRRNAVGANPRLSNLVPAPCSWSCMGFEATLGSCRIRDSRPHPLQLFNDPQPTAGPVNCPHFPNCPGAWVPCFLSLPVPAHRFFFLPACVLTICCLLDFCCVVASRAFSFISRHSISQHHSTQPVQEVTTLSRLEHTKKAVTPAFGLHEELLCLSSLYSKYHRIFACERCGFH